MLMIERTCRHGMTVTFCAPSRGGYVHQGNLAGPQPCEGGGYTGSTLSCGPSEGNFALMVDRWIRQARDAARKVSGCWAHNYDSYQSALNDAEL